MVALGTIPRAGSAPMVAVRPRGMGGVADD
jgi:hypothetical protein